jgi:hypothetical protein
MGKFFQNLTPAQRDFIVRQKIFFAASAPNNGRVNVSPKGMDTFRVLTDTHVGYLDVTGSGNETAAHLADNGRLTLMFCAFEAAPMILRLYTRARVVRSGHEDWAQFRPLFGPALPGERQLILADVESVQTSCGFGVPFFDYQGDRDQLNVWAERKGPEGVAAYWSEKNVKSIDGLPTGILNS